MQCWYIWMDLYDLYVADDTLGQAGGQGLCHLADNCLPSPLHATLGVESC